MIGIYRNSKAQIVTRVRSQSWHRLVTSLKLPVPLPPELKRASHAISTKELEGRRILVHPRPAAARFQAILVPARAEIATAVPTGGQPEADCQGLVMEISAHDTVPAIQEFYDVAKRALSRLSLNARIVVVVRRGEGSSLSDQARTYSSVVEGFTRSLARELGRQGSTVNLLVDPDEQTAPAAPLIFLLSDRCSYITGQAIEVNATPNGVACQSDHLLTGKRAVVTGAACGIGRATARALAREGARVMAIDRPGNTKFAALSETPGIDPLDLDITGMNAADQLRAELSDGIDILIHNAGITRDRTLAKMSREEWRAVLEVNLLAPVRLTEELIQSNRMNDDGRIIALSSISGIAGNFGQTNYAAAKAGLIGYAQQLSSRLVRQRITGNVVAPGFIETRLTRRMPAPVRLVARRMNALAQTGRPDDVAEAVTFLASPGAQAINGRVLRVCGGSIMGR